jgi:hypothetical protein
MATPNPDPKKTNPDPKKTDPGPEDDLTDEDLEEVSGGTGNTPGYNTPPPPPP